MCKDLKQKMKNMRRVCSGVAYSLSRSQAKQVYIDRTNPLVCVWQCVGGHSYVHARCLCLCDALRVFQVG